MEGVSGIVKPEQTSGGDPMYEEGRKLYTEEINAAVRGAKAGGATEIVVMDCHGAGGGWTFNSLVPELLHEDCEWVVQEEWTGYTEFLEQGCDAALFVGMHAMAGTQDGNMNHTVSGRDYQRLWFNGAEVGETGINAALCGTWGCPVLLVTGDEASCREGKELLGDGPHHRRGQVGVRLGRGAADPAGAGAEADRGRREEGTRRPEGGAAVRPRQPLRDQGRVQAHAAGRPAPLPPRRRAARRPHDPRRGAHVVGCLEALLLRDLTAAAGGSTTPSSSTSVKNARANGESAVCPRTKSQSICSRRERASSSTEERSGPAR